MRRWSLNAMWMVLRLFLKWHFGMYLKFCSGQTWHFSHLYTFLRFNEKEQEDIQSDYKQVDGGIYNVEISAQLKRAQIDDDSNVACLVRIPDANYSRKESITYDGENEIKC